MFIFQKLDIVLRRKLFLSFSERQSRVLEKAMF